MRRIFYALAFVCLSALGFAQTATVSGHTITGQNSTSSSGIGVLFELINDNGQQCKVAGSGLITPYSLTVTQAQLAAGISLIENSQITCGTTTGATRWRYTIKSGGIGTRQCVVNITTTTNLDSTACLNATSTPVSVTPTDSVYCRIDGSNCGFTNTVTDSVAFGAPLFTCIEGAAPSGSVGSDLLYCDSSLHRPRFINNNGASATVALLTDSIASFTGTLTSLQLAAIVSDETGSGVLVFGTSPTLTAPAISSPTTTGTDAGTETLGGKTINNGGLAFAGSVSGSTTIKGGSAASGTATLPVGSGTIIEDGLTQTMSGKTLTAPVVNTPTFTAMCNNNNLGCKTQTFTTFNATGTTQGSSATTALTWTSAFANANYKLTCTPFTPTGTPGGIDIESKAAGGFTLRIFNLGVGAAANYGSLDCIAIAD